MSGPVLCALDAAGTRSTWRAAGFAVDGDGAVRIGHVAVRTGAAARGIGSWTFAALEPGAVGTDGVDGLATAGGGMLVEPAVHPNGAALVDHVVVWSPDGDRTTRALEALGLPVRRVVEATRSGMHVRQTFLRAGEVIVELVSPVDSPAGGAGSARFFGIACTVVDLDACAALLGDVLEPVRDAVQPERRIATLRHKQLGLDVAVAFMSPPPT